MPTTNLEMVVTNTGLTAAQAASVSGTPLSLGEFRLGSAVGYSPVGADTALHGSSVYTGAITSYSNLPDGTTLVSMVIDPSAGPFSFGEIGVYIGTGPSAPLFALGSFPNLQYKYSTGIGGGANSTFTFIAHLKLAQAATVLNLSMIATPSSDIYLPWSGVVNASLMTDSRIKRIVITDPDSHNNLPSLAQRPDGTWSVETVMNMLMDGISTVTSTTSYCEISTATWQTYLGTTETLATQLARFSGSTFVLEVTAGAVANTFRKVTASVQGSNIRFTYSVALAAAATGTIRVYLNDVFEIDGTMATQNANNVAITGGTVSGITDLAVSDGGTGASTASGARTNLGLTIGTDVPSPSGTGATGTWNISVSGNAATATNASAITITDDSASATPFYPALSPSSGSGQSQRISSAKLSFVPSTGVFSATSFSGAGTGLTGTAAGLSIGGNAGSVTNGVYTTVGYSNPAWLLALAGSKITGSVADALNVSGTIGGAVTAVTKSPGNNSTSPSTTEYVDRAVGASAAKIQPITATVAGAALTITLNPTALDFRSPTGSSGAVNTRYVLTPLTITVPQFATLGSSSGVLGKVVVIAMDNGGTVELAVIGLPYSVSLDESELVNTATLSSSSSVAGTAYSNTSRSNLPFRVVGYVESSQTTAGQWVSAPSKVQGAGGLAVSGLVGLGYAQGWVDVTASRSIGSTYYNTTGRPIFVVVSQTTYDNGAHGMFFVNGLQINDLFSIGGDGALDYKGHYVVVPPGGSYGLTGGPIVRWTELR